MVLYIFENHSNIMYTLQKQRWLNGWTVAETTSRITQWGAGTKLTVHRCMLLWPSTRNPTNGSREKSRPIYRGVIYRGVVKRRSLRITKSWSTTQACRGYSHGRNLRTENALATRLTVSQMSWSLLGPSTRAEYIRASCTSPITAATSRMADKRSR